MVGNGHEYLNALPCNGVDKSYAMAREWWAKGAEQGNKDCMRDLKKMDEEETTPTTKATAFDVTKEVE